MYDPDPASPVLRLSELAETAEERHRGYLRKALQDPAIKAALHAPVKPATVEEADARLAAAETVMQQSIMWWVDCHMEWAALRMQAQPIPASRPAAQPERAMHRLFDGFVRPAAQTDAQALARYQQGVGQRPVVFRADGRVEALG